MVSKQAINTRLRHPTGVQKCDKCSRDAVIFIRYSGAHLCGGHFSEFVEKRVKHELRRQLELRGAEKMAVAVSGGKDSIVALHLIDRILGNRKDMEICAITVDEGISGYRGPSIPIVAEICKEIGVEHTIVSFRGAFGVTMDEIAGMKRDIATCSYCGVLRRAAMNKAARECNADHLATGLNLDDTAQSILMNFARGDVERLARLGPHRRIQPGLVPRIQPLRSIPESETTLYAIVNNLRYHDLECPYAPEALRNSYRSAVFELEDRYPGTRHSILRSYDKLLPALEETFEQANLRTCECGEPTISERCKACELIESVRNSSRT
jgi:uncharacterized protein (TIGR00269 family)